MREARDVGTTSEGVPGRRVHGTCSGYAEWDALDQPVWDRLGLAVDTSEGQHNVWLDGPDGAHAWAVST